MATFGTGRPQKEVRRHLRGNKVSQTGDSLDVQLGLTLLPYRYTKALDEIKKLRKEQAIEIKIDTEKLIALKTDRERATKASTARPVKVVHLS